VDNPGLYSVFYAGDSEAGAIAEAFGRFPEWGPAMLRSSPNLPGSFRSIATYRLPDSTAVCNLDDPVQLIALDLRPSQVVSRDYMVTRGWARRIFEQGKWAGVRWWSYYDPRWSSYALWDPHELVLEAVRPLRLNDRALVDAARITLRRVVDVKKPAARTMR